MDIAITATKRKVTGRKVKNLRKQGILPSNVYGKKVNSISLQVKTKDFKEVYEKAGETGLVELNIEGDSKTKKGDRAVLIHNVQKDPVTDELLHVDFYQVDLKEKVTTKVPIELIGETPAEKSGIGTTVQYLDEIEVEALPMNLPEKFEVDLSNLEEVDQATYIKDLKIDATKATIKQDPKQVIIKVEPLRKEEVAEEPEEEKEEEEEGKEVEEGEEVAEDGKKTVEKKVDAKEPEKRPKDKEQSSQ